MSAPEFSRTVKLRAIRQEPLSLEADAAERAALAARFGISAIDSLHAAITLDPDGDRIAASGRLQAAIVQACAISGDDFPVAIDEDLEFVFVPAGREASAQEGEEIELEREQLDEIEYHGDSFDLGEAIAQSLALAIDPYAEGPGADAAREQAGLGTEDAPSGPLAEALAALRKS